MNRSEPRVSVVIPTHNRAGSLSASIESVLSQTHGNLEVIVVDDCSTDNTSEVVARIGDSRVRYIRAPARGGAGAARNLGVKHAQEEYIAFHDSDDVWFSEKLEKQMRLFAEDPELGVVYCAFWRTERGIRECIPSSKRRHVDGDVFEEMLKGNLVSTQTAVVRRRCFDSVGTFDTGLPPLEDWDLFIRLASFCRFGFVDEPLAESIVGSDSISADRIGRLEAYAGIIEKHRADFRKHRRLLSKHFGSIGNGFCLAGEVGRGRKFLARGIAVYPLAWKCVAGLLVSLVGRGFYETISRLRTPRTER